MGSWVTWLCECVGTLVVWVKKLHGFSGSRGVTKFCVGQLSFGLGLKFSFGRYFGMGRKFNVILRIKMCVCEL